MLTFVHGAIITQLAATHASWSDIGTFVVAAAIVLAGAIGVVIARNPVHAALMLVMTLFGIAVLFVLQRADFLAAVQVIVYAGAIVVLFLFVIMFLGVALAGVLILGLVSHWTTGKPSVAGRANGPGSNVFKLGHSVFTTYLFPFEVTSALLVIAVVGAVVLARRPPSGDKPVPDAIDATGEAFESAGDGTGDATASTTGEGIDSTTATIDEEVAP